MTPHTSWDDGFINSSPKLILNHGLLQQHSGLFSKAANETQGAVSQLFTPKNSNVHQHAHAHGRAAESGVSYIAVTVVVVVDPPTQGKT